MRTVFTRCFPGILVASLPVALCACPPENTAQSFDGPTGAPTVVDMKSYWPMTYGNTWFLEDKNWKHVTWVLDDYWVGSTEVCKMRFELTGEWGTEVSEYYLLWRDDYVLHVPEEGAQYADFLAGLDFVPPRLEEAFAGTSILFQRFVETSGTRKSHDDGANTIYHATSTLASVSQMLCGSSTKLITPELYPLPPSTEVVLQRESDTPYCDAGTALPVTQIFAQGIGPVSRHNLRIHVAIIFDEDGSNYTLHEFNDNGFQY